MASARSRSPSARSGSPSALRKLRIAVLRAASELPPLTGIVCSLQDAVPSSPLLALQSAFEDALAKEDMMVAAGLLAGASPASPIGPSMALRSIVTKAVLEVMGLNSIGIDDPLMSAGEKSVDMLGALCLHQRIASSTWPCS